VLIANASKSQILDIAKMLEVLDCSKSFPFGLCQKLLSVKNHLSLKLFFFYKLSSRLKLVWAFYLLSAREDLESFRSAKSSPYIDNVYGKTWEGRTFFQPGAKVPRVLLELWLRAKCPESKNTLKKTWFGHRFLQAMDLASFKATSYAQNYARA